MSLPQGFRSISMCENAIKISKSSAEIPKFIWHLKYILSVNPTKENNISKIFKLDNRLEKLLYLHCLERTDCSMVQEKLDIHIQKNNNNKIGPSHAIYKNQIQNTLNI